MTQYENVSSLVQAGIHSLSDNSDDLIGRFILPLQQAIPRLREILIDKKVIIPYEDKETMASITQYPVMSIDGGRVTKPQAYFDLVSIAAGLAEGRRCVPHKYEDDNFPSIVYNVLSQHSSEVDKTTTPLLMSAAELMMLDKADSYLKIIDGAWSSNFTQLFIALTDAQEGSLKTFFNFLLAQKKKEGWTDGYEIVNSLDRLIYPAKYVDHPSNIIALSKSDSASNLSSDFNDKDAGFFDDDVEIGELLMNLKPKNRFLASLVLKEGEMISPRAMNIGSTIPMKLELEESQTFKAIELLKNSKKEFSSQDYKYLSNVVNSILVSSNDDKTTLEKIKSLQSRSQNHSWIWTTYFKPYVGGRILKMEFSRTEPNESDIIAKGRKLATIVSADMVEGYKEPYSQWLVDRRAKKVSDVSKIFQEQVLQKINNFDPNLASTISESYRS